MAESPHCCAEKGASGGGSVVSWKICELRLCPVLIWEQRWQVDAGHESRVRWGCPGATSALRLSSTPPLHCVCLLESVVLLGVLGLAVDISADCGSLFESLLMFSGRMGGEVSSAALQTLSLQRPEVDTLPRIPRTPHL